MNRIPDQQRAGRLLSELGTGTKHAYQLERSTMASFTTHLDAEIARARKVHAERIAKLKRAAAAEQRRIDEKIVRLLKEVEPEQYEQFAAQAVDALAAEKVKRSQRARRHVPVVERLPGNAEQADAQLCAEGGSADEDQ